MDVAIVGMAGRFPGARDLAELWENLRDGIESISFLTDEELAAAGVPSEEYEQPGYVRAAARLTGIDLFDAEFFGYTPREAEVMDPQQRLFLETAWEALEHAGYDSTRVSGGVGVFGGAGANGYLHNVYSNPRVVESVGQTQILIGNELGFLTSRVSYKLDLRGPSISLRTACSTSLVALHLAGASLRRQECSLALAGACFVNLGQDRGYLHQEGSFMSPDGHCRPFDAKAQGTVFGSGVGIVVLKRLADARRDGDTIYAVIKGSAVNNDGAVKVGFTAPSVTGQAGVIADALESAGTPAESIRYVEAHGTGTVLGDPIELQALTQAYRRSTDRVGFCRLGSLKSNTGHLDAAAGVAGLIKTVLALQHEALPPTLHFTSANAAFDLAGSPFQVQSALEPWPRDDQPRRAAVSAFGFGGTNAHVIVEEAPAAEPSGPSRPAQLLTLSARTPEALEAMTDRLADHLRRHSPNLADVAFTLGQGRCAFAHRRAVVAATVAEAVTALEAREPSRVVTGATNRERVGTVFLFSGQGAQFPGMAHEVYAAEPVFRAAVDECAQLLQDELGLDIRDIIFAEETESATDRLRQTALAQPGLFVVEYALAMLWRSWGVTPVAMLGHSLGEYVAACLAEVFTLADALRLVALRGRLMQEMPSGSMLGVVAGRDDLLEILPGGLWLAAHNGPQDCVVAGPTDAVATFAADASRRGLVTQPIATSHAFHSGLMAPMVDPFVATVAAVAAKAPAIPFVSNVTGTWITDEEAQDPAYWGRQILSPVEFARGVTEVADRGQVLLEVGPGQTLSSLARRVLGGGSDRVSTSSLPHQRDQRGAVERVYRALGHLWIAGHRPDWDGLFAGERRRRIPLPPYPFERRSFWLQPRTGEAARGGAFPARRRFDDWFYTPSWTQAPRPVAEEVAGPWLVFQDEIGLGKALAHRLSEQGARVFSVEVGQWAHDGDTFWVDPSQSADYSRLVQVLRDECGELPRRIVHLWSVSDLTRTRGLLDDLQRAQVYGFESLIRLSQAMNSAPDSAARRLWIVSNGVHCVTGDERLAPAKATLLGPVRVVPREHPGWDCTNVDIAATEPATQVVDQLLGEITSVPAGGCVAYRGRHRWLLKYHPIALPEPKPPSEPIRAGGVYLVTGGLGGIGLAIAQDLAAVGARIVLTGRTALPPADQWHAWLASDPGDGRVTQIVRRLVELSASGAEILVAQADVSDPEAIGAALDLAKQRWNQDVEGIFHAAGVASGGLVQVKEMPTARAVLRPKLEGTLALQQAIAGRDVRFVVLFGSNAANLGDFGQIDYVAANAFLDAYAHACDGSGRVIAVDWGPWQEIGMAVNTEVPEALKAVRQQDIMERGMAPSEGLAALRRILGSSTPPQVVVSPVELDVLFESAFSLGTGYDGLAELKPTEPAHPRPELANSFQPPHTHAQRRICAAWQELLGIDQVGIDDNFFDLGGNSLVAIQLIGAVNRELDTQLTVARLYECLTVSRLAAVVDDTEPAEAGGLGLLEERKERMQQRRLHQQQRRAAKGR